jgi:hypothetical protein
VHSSKQIMQIYCECGNNNFSFVLGWNLDRLFLNITRLICSLITTPSTSNTRSASCQQALYTKGAEVGRDILNVTIFIKAGFFQPVVHLSYVRPTCIFLSCYDTLYDEK